MKKTIQVFALLSILALGACNTIEGMGQDLRSLGESITGSAQKAR